MKRYANVISPLKFTTACQRSQKELRKKQRKELLDTYTCLHWPNHLGLRHQRHPFEFNTNIRRSERVTEFLTYGYMISIIFSSLGSCTTQRFCLQQVSSYSVLMHILDNKGAALHELLNKDNEASKHQSEAPRILSTLKDIHWSSSTDSARKI